MDAYPTRLEKTDDGRLIIHWSDGQALAYPFAALRDACPCATCREKRKAPPPPPNQLRVISPEEAQPPAVTGMRPVGNYAYNIAFNDGHDTGIFTFELLRDLGQPVDSNP